MTQAAPPTRMRWLRPFTTHIFNRLSRHFATWMPMFGIIENVGRKSGTTYWTPMNVFRDRDGWVFALTYGSDVQWVKNVLASGRCTLITRRKRHELVSPRLVVDPARRSMPTPVRQFLGLLRVSEFLYLDEER